MLDSITISRTYPHPIEKVWFAITDSTALSRWLMPNDFVAEEGHTFTFTTDPGPGFDGTIYCKVISVREPDELSYSWSSGNLKTIVRFRLTSTPEGKTRLDFEHSGFSGLKNKLFIRNLLAMGWKRKLLTVKLTQYLNTHV